MKGNKTTNKQEQRQETNIKITRRLLTGFTAKQNDNKQTNKNKEPK